MTHTSKRYCLCWGVGRERNDSLSLGGMRVLELSVGLPCQPVSCGRAHDPSANHQHIKPLLDPICRKASLVSVSYKERPQRLADLSPTCRLPHQLNHSPCVQAHATTLEGP